MTIRRLDHVNIRTADLATTRAFYTEVMGMTEGYRPPFDFPGAWLKPPVPGAAPSIHVYAGKAINEFGGANAPAAAAIDHVSIAAQGFDELRERLRAHGLEWREGHPPDTELWQLFVHDPSGILLELTFDQNAEGGRPPQLTEGRRYRAGEPWFDPRHYARFRGAGAPAAAE
jgi:catechol 2,3-dioxygenase-like lactoylglutathione lyase family enzyme